MSQSKELNGIPTSYYFKKKLGRKGLSGAMKRSNDLIDQICKALKEAESYRVMSSMDAINRIRLVRRTCNVATGTWKNRLSLLELDQISELYMALSARINTVASHIYRAGKAQNIETLNERIFESFYQDLAVRADMGPGRSLNKGYQLERATSRHLPGALTTRWLNSPTQLSLNTWIDTVCEWEKEDEYRTVIVQQTVQPTVQVGVRYLSDREKKMFSIDINGGVVKDSSGNMMHTGHYSSNAGSGWAIYVLGFDDRFYCGQHNTNKFHHSSFFSGAPVRAGGEIAINQGKIVGLTNKTGHYKARGVELNTVLNQFVQRGVNIDNIAVQDPFRAPGKWFSAKDAMSVYGALSRLGNKTVAKPIAPQ
ncbi:MAG: hypothetical protein ACI92O_000385 [Colwellia sp.]|jgi:hypothetical protein